MNPIDPNIESKISAITSQYLLDMKKDLLYNRLPVASDIYHVWLISECFSQFSQVEQRELLTICLRVLQHEKASIERRSMVSLSFFGGLSEVYFITRKLSENTGCFVNFLRGIEALLINKTLEYSAYCKDNIRNLRTFHYDAISGLSGIGYSLLLSNTYNNEACIKLLNAIVEYMRLLIRPDSAGKPCWYIKSYNQNTREEMQQFPEGHFDFSLSHGIAGPLQFLTEAKHKGVLCYNDYELLVKYVDVFESWASIRNSELCWPTKLSYKKYFSRENEPIKGYSWCYGTPSIYRVLMNAYSALGALDKSSSIQRYFEQAIHPEKSVCFDESIVCHGYSSLLCFLVCHMLDSNGIQKDEYLIEICEFICQNTDLKYTSPLANENLFLNGKVGVLLALNSAIHKKESILQHLMLQ